MSRVWPWAAVALLSLLTWILLLLLPLSGLGVHGNALAPTYDQQFTFGVSSYAPLPEHPTAADLRKAGIVLPTERVEDRRRHAALVPAVALIIASGGLLLQVGRSASNGNGHRRGAPAQP